VNSATVFVKKKTINAKAKYNHSGNEDKQQESSLHATLHKVCVEVVSKFGKLLCHRDFNYNRCYNILVTSHTHN
jgi:hypothetical protein